MAVASDQVARLGRTVALDLFAPVASFRRSGLPHALTVLRVGEAHDVQDRIGPGEPSPGDFRRSPNGLLDGPGPGGRTRGMRFARISAKSIAADAMKKSAVPLSIVTQQIAAAVHLMAPVPVYFGLELVLYPGIIDITPALVDDMVAAGRAGNAAGTIISWDMMHALQGRHSCASSGALMPADAPAIAIRGSSKRFPGVDALDGIDLEIRSAEVHALVGQNGAGKSTLIKILSRLSAPSAYPRPARAAGEVRHAPRRDHGRHCGDYTGDKPRADSERRGEHPAWTPSNARARTRRLGLRAQPGPRLLSRLGFDIDPRVPVAGLTIAQQQGVEIARALSREAAIVIMDEPTSALAAREVERLLETIVRLRENGTSIIYVSHRMDEGFPDFGSHQRSTGRPPGGTAEDDRDQSGGSRPAHDRARGPKGIGARSTGDRHTDAGA